MRQEGASPQPSLRLLFATRDSETTVVVETHAHIALTVRAFHPIAGKERTTNAMKRGCGREAEMLKSSVFGEEL